MTPIACESRPRGRPIRLGRMRVGARPSALRACAHRAARAPATPHVPPGGARRRLCIAARHTNFLHNAGLAPTTNARSHRERRDDASFAVVLTNLVLASDQMLGFIIYSPRARARPVAAGISHEPSAVDRLQALASASVRPLPEKAPIGPTGNCQKPTTSQALNGASESNDASACDLSVSVRSARARPPPPIQDENGSPTPISPYFGRVATCICEKPVPRWNRPMPGRSRRCGDAEQNKAPTTLEMQHHRQQWKQVCSPLGQPPALGPRAASIPRAPDSHAQPQHPPTPNYKHKRPKAADERRASGSGVQKEGGTRCSSTTASIMSSMETCPNVSLAEPHLPKGIRTRRKGPGKVPLKLGCARYEFARDNRSRIGLAKRGL